MNLNAYVDGGLTDTQTFNWNGNSGFLTQEMASVGNGNRIDNYTISTVPEPATWAIMAGGFGMLLAARRFRRPQA
ncbi:MAG TPA: PEP-CTERM sorting domain-containing protein [Candidatus Limnocylindrales bacterium]|nr:PEP-CTERM sorting domain-containing protein [Candidatus Limnocylindrales bacterium]